MLQEKDSISYSTERSGSMMAYDEWWKVRCLFRFEVSENSKVEIPMKKQESTISRKVIDIKRYAFTQAKIQSKNPISSSTLE